MAQVDSLAPDYYYEPHLPPAPIQHSPSLRSLSPSLHSNPAFSRSSTSNTLAHDSLLYNSDVVPPLPPLAAPQPRAGKASLASLHAAAGLGLDHQVSYPPSFGGNDLENQHRENTLNSNHLQVSGTDSSLKERQAYRSTTPVVNGESRFGSPSPSPEKRGQQHGIYPPSSILKNSQSTSQFSNYEKPGSIRSVRPSGTAPNLHRLGFSDVKQQGKPPMSRRRKQIITLGITLGIIAIIAIVVPIAFVVNKNSTAAAAASSAAATATATKVSGGTVFPGSGSGANVSDGIDLSAYYSSTNPLNPLASPTSMSIQSGTSGSTINSYVNGSAVTFTYTNTFGGYYYYDPTNPFAKGGKAQSWSPAIEEEWVWGRDIVRGINLGGWLVPEPFIGTSVCRSNLYVFLTFSASL